MEKPITTQQVHINRERRENPRPISEYFSEGINNIKLIIDLNFNYFENLTFEIFKTEIDDESFSKKNGPLFNLFRASEYFFDVMDLYQKDPRSLFSLIQQLTTLSQNPVAPDDFFRKELVAYTDFSEKIFEQINDEIKQNGEVSEEHIIEYLKNIRGRGRCEIGKLHPLQLDIAPLLDLSFWQKNFPNEKIDPLTIAAISNLYDFITKKYVIIDSFGDNHNHSFGRSGWKFRMFEIFGKNFDLIIKNNIIPTQNFSIVIGYIYFLPNTIPQVPNLIDQTTRLKRFLTNDDLAFPVQQRIEEYQTLKAQIIEMFEELLQKAES